MKRILVTGADGFIGRKLTERLIAEGYEVTGFDLRHGDICEKDALEKNVELPVDYTFHLAGKTFVPDSWNDPQDFYRVNVLGTLNVLEFCRRSGSGLTFVSSYVYGKPEYLPVDEKHPVKPFNPYSHSKIIAEELCRYYCDEFGIESCILRPFNIYGPGQSDRFLIPEIIKKVLDPSTEVVEINYERPKRDFLYIDDLICALIKTMTAPRTFYNIGRGESISVKDLICFVFSITGISKQIISLGKERQMEIFDLYADIKKISHDLSWKQKTLLSEGLKLSITHLKNLRK